MEWAKLLDIWPVFTFIAGLVVAQVRLFFRVEINEKVIEEHKRQIADINVLISELRQENRKTLDDYADLEREEHEKIINGFKTEVDKLAARFDANASKLESKIDQLVQYNLSRK